MTIILARTCLGVLAGTLSALAMLCSPASATISTFQCGAPIKSTVKRMINNSFTTTSTAFVNVPGAGVTVNVPAGQTRCVRVRFSAVASCSGAGGCYIQVHDSLSPFHFGPNASFATGQPASAARSYEWVGRLDAGSHPIRIQAAVNTGVTFDIIQWILAVDTAN